MAGELFKPHDHLFRTVFREESEAAGLLRAYLPEAVAGELRWSSLKRQDVSFIDDWLRASEADLLYAVERKVDDTPAWMYVLFEHQSTPAGPEDLRGGVRGRIVQTVQMAAFRGSWPVLETAAGAGHPT